MRLFHTSDRILPEPDVHYGRVNADFGQGFYLTPEREFALRWAGERAVINVYELDLSGLKVHRFERDAAHRRQEQERYWQALGDAMAEISDPA
ncbi:MAG: DUF3990 domain-containing protein [Eubacteriales bacterium]|nr:DUF3990 domain-containing protein [Eubacteriales bacterium]